MDRVLVVDDNDAIQKLVSANLQIRGYAVMRRAKSSGSDKLPEIRLKDLTIDIQGRRAFVGGTDMHLTRTEFAPLAELAQNQEAILTHEDLLARVWGPEYRDPSHYLHVYLGRIRKKLGPDLEALLETVPGVSHILHSAA